MSKKNYEPPFIEIPAASDHFAWCIDGRPDPNSEKGPQMPGGSLFPILLKAIYENMPFHDSLITQAVNMLKTHGITPGVHDGHHAHGNASDCGFADRMPDIVQKAIHKKDEIMNRFSALLQQEMIDDSFTRAVQHAYTFIESYTPDMIQITGQRLITTMEEHGATLEHVQGDHQEIAAFINLKPQTTLDTNALNNQGMQAFNFDLWVVHQRAKILEIHDESFVTGASLILYMATEMVLVEDKGKIPIPILIHK